MAARASGLDTDFRRDHPHDAYEGLRFEVPVEAGGDVRARLMVRAREVEQSLSIVRQVLDAMPASSEASLTAPLPKQLPARASALGGWKRGAGHARIGSRPTSGARLPASRSLTRVF